MSARLFAFVSCWILSAILAGPAAGQADRRGQPFPDGFPFADPNRFFEQFFGRESAEDRAALEKIKISVKEEQQAGRQAAQQFLDDLKRRGIKVTTRGADVAYLEKLVASVYPQMRNKARYRSLRIYLAESNNTDAFAFPGGTLVFFRGMLEFAQSEAALVGVIGHELSHLDRQHQLHQVRQMKLARQTFSGQQQFSPDQFFRNGRLLMQSFMRPFRPEDEAEADQDGATWAFQAGYDPREMAKLFRRMAERDHGGRDFVPSFLRTHPYHADRLRAVLDLHAKLSSRDPAKKLYIGTENLRLRVPRSEREFAE